MKNQSVLQISLGVYLELNRTSRISQVPSNLIFLTILVTLRPLIQFNIKLKQLSCKKIQKITLLDNYFADLFSEVQIWY